MNKELKPWEVEKDHPKTDWKQKDECLWIWVLKPVLNQDP